jgi:hypothetical protein
VNEWHVRGRNPRRPTDSPTGLFPCNSRRTLSGACSANVAAAFSWAAQTLPAALPTRVPSAPPSGAPGTQFAATRTQRTSLYHTNSLNLVKASDPCDPALRRYRRLSLTVTRSFRISVAASYRSARRPNENEFSRHKERR